MAFLAASSSALLFRLMIRALYSARSLSFSASVRFLPLFRFRGAGNGSSPSPAALLSAAACFSAACFLAIRCCLALKISMPRGFSILAFVGKVRVGGAIVLADERFADEGFADEGFAAEELLQW